MDDKRKIFIYFTLILLLGVITACSATPEPTAAPTNTTGPTAQPAVEEEPTALPVVEPEIIFINNETVVENITVQEKDEETGEIVVMVEGFTSNSCAIIDDVTIKQEGEVFVIEVNTSIEPGEGCVEEKVQFEESISIDTEGISPGEYLVSSGDVGTFEIGAAEETEDTPAAETAVSEETGTQGEPTADELRDCVDTALFIADVTYPDNTIIAAGETITKTWEIQNTGTCSWGPGYELEFATGEFTEVSSLADPFPVVEPSETVELSVVATAPATADIHKGAWVIQRPEGDNILLDEGVAFDLWVIVIVSRESAGGDGSVAITIVQDGAVCAESKPSYESEILELINQARTDEGLNTLELQPQLTNAARRLTTDMACNDFVSQTGSDGSDWFDRISTEGYVYSDAAEIIFVGIVGPPELAFNWWMDKVDFAANILDPDFTEIGIAYAFNPQTGKNHYSVVFAIPGE